ncbi:MAG: portal protein [Alphaproteobacteria bacterium]|jgi:hypothetical protein|nr:portal protein [Alphaproteobacteria bacterium]
MKKIPEINSNLINRDTLIKEYKKAKNKRSNWENLWEDCIKYSSPERYGSFYNSFQEANKNNVDIYDSTAICGVENLVSTIASSLTPSYEKWFNLSLGNITVEDETTKANIEKDIEKIEKTISENISLSNFATEIQQCYFDLVTLGTSCLFFEENQIGKKSAFRFKSVPLNQLTIDEDSEGNVNKIYRETSITVENLQLRFPEFFEENGLSNLATKFKEERVKLIEAVVPNMKEIGQQGFVYTAFIEDEKNILTPKKSAKEDNILVLKEGVLQSSPFICFRWLKTSSEVYGRSPVMKVLPDIKTANKVVELTLQNATIAISGVWQAEDDGVINFNNIDLSPGSIIPKAIGSQGLSPLQTGANFNVSQLVLSDLRNNINKAFYTDVLGKPEESKQMTATEVSARTMELYQTLTAVFSRLQTELLTPLIERAVSILKRRGEIANLIIDGNIISLKYSSPIMNVNNDREIANIQRFISSLSILGEGQLSNIIDTQKLINHLAEITSIPKGLLKTA